MAGRKSGRRVAPPGQLWFLPAADARCGSASAAIAARTSAALTRARKEWMGVMPHARGREACETAGSRAGNEESTVAGLHRARWMSKTGLQPAGAQVRQEHGGPSLATLAGGEGRDGTPGKKGRRKVCCWGALVGVRRTLARCQALLPANPANRLAAAEVGCRRPTAMLSAVLRDARCGRPRGNARQ